MKVFKKIMNAVAAVEKFILVVSTLLILILTVGNVFSRKVIHRSWFFTEELVVAVFVLVTLMAAALACREGELVNLSLVTDRLPEKMKKPSVILSTILCVIFTAILFRFGMDKVPHAACKWKTYLCIELAGVDLLVFCSHWIRMYDFTFYRILH